MPGNDVVLLDATGLICPLPVLKARKAMKTVRPGGVLRVLATDRGATKDFAAFCEATGHQLLSSSEESGVLTFEIRRVVG
jgi:tRNA 2-thiouridine synthesizing protein A